MSIKNFENPPRRWLPSAAARSLDEAASSRLGLPIGFLMENAGAGLAREALRLTRVLALRRILVLAGSGNNGGDGFAAARRLLADDLDVRVFLLGEPDPRKSPDSAHQLRILARCDARIQAIGRDFETALDREGDGLLVLDALFGTGLSRPLAGAARAVVEILNHAAAPVLAVDVPSGLDADTGVVLGAAVRAHTTVTFVAPKPGLFLGEGPSHSGRVVVADLGLPPRFVAEFLVPATAPRTVERPP